jgi:glutamate/tyrosine decarboxylase-like PLP-dependent enzyme
MLSEQTIASQLAWFATMLCNPNNVVSEVSPVTTRLELEVAAQLAALIGYRPEQAWGHLTSGGTIANFEALWIARGVRYLPVGLALAVRQLSLHLPVRLPNGDEGDLRDLPLWELLNLTPTAALDAYDQFHREVPAEVARRALDEHSLSAIGYQDYTRRLASVWTDPLPAGIVLVPGTAHYSWEKIVRALGIGSGRLVTVAVERHARMDPDALASALAGAAASRTPVLAVVAVCGSTEEGSVDQLDELVTVRDAAARSHGTALHLHVDACYGGYAAALTRATDGARLSGAAIREHTGTDWPDDAWVAAITALERADSVTIDPHKLGFVPYPAGAFLLRDKRGRNLVSLDPPYLSPPAEGEPEGFLGRWILEGSKPGAAAAAVWLSHRVVPLDVTGHGKLVHRTMAGARRLHAALGVPGALGEDFLVVRLPSPDLNLVGWVVHDPRLQQLEQVNALNEGIYSRLGGAGVEPPYWITRTRLKAPGSRGVALPLVAALGLPAAAWEQHGLVVLRVTVMDPFFAESPPSAPDHCGGLVRAVATAAKEAVASLLA